MHRSSSCRTRASMHCRYQSLQLHGALSRRNDYLEACRELRCILRGAYVYAPKPFQEELHQDVVHAFRMLPGMENSRQLEAVKALLHAVEDLFPKEKRALAALEYITAVAARHKTHKEPETPPERSDLSRDLLLHVFKSLDARSLATAAAVCREWNVAATDDTLWHTQFLYVFGSPYLTINDTTATTDVKQEDLFNYCWNAEILQKPLNGVWRKAFNLGAKVQPSHLLTSSRAFCSCCNEVLWLIEPAWKSAKGKCVANKHTFEYHSARPMSVSQVVRHVVSHGVASASDLSSTDSD